MNYLFNFSFAFEGPDADDDGKEVEFCFLLDEAATARTGYATTDMAGADETPFSVWFGKTTAELEEEFAAVHDYSGTGDDHTLVEGFCTYEIDTIDKARELMLRWRNAFVEFLGEEGVGPVVEIPENAIDYSTQAPSDLRDLVARLSKPASSHPPGP